MKMRVGGGNGRLEFFQKIIQFGSRILSLASFNEKNYINWIIFINVKKPNINILLIYII